MCVMCGYIITDCRWWNCKQTASVTDKDGIALGTVKRTSVTDNNGGWGWEGGGEEEKNTVSCPNLK